MSDNGSYVNQLASADRADQMASEGPTKPAFRWNSDEYDINRDPTGRCQRTVIEDGRIKAYFQQKILDVGRPTRKVLQVMDSVTPPTPSTQNHVLPRSKAFTSAR